MRGNGKLTLDVCRKRTLSVSAGHSLSISKRVNVAKLGRWAFPLRNSGAEVCERSIQGRAGIMP